MKLGAIVFEGEDESDKQVHVRSYISETQNENYWLIEINNHLGVDYSRSNKMQFIILHSNYRRGGVGETRVSSHCIFTPILESCNRNLYVAWKYKASTFIFYKLFIPNRVHMFKIKYSWMDCIHFSTSKTWKVWNWAISIEYLWHDKAIIFHGYGNDSF